MGIEPTDRTVYVRSNGFEDRGHHQVCKHFQVVFCMVWFLGWGGEVRCALRPVEAGFAADAFVEVA